MHIVKDAYDRLCEARDALDARPADGPERERLFKVYLDARIKQINRAQSALRPIDPIPAMNRRFFVMGGGTIPVSLELDLGELRQLRAGGDGRGWSDVKHLPRLRARVPMGATIRRPPSIMDNLQRRSNFIVSRPLLEIWQRFDAQVLDTLPFELEGRRGQPVAETYFLVDITRTLPALNLEAMHSFLLNSPKDMQGNRTVEVFPVPRAYALRDDLPTEGIHLFREQTNYAVVFVSAELRQACLDAGFKDVYFTRPEDPYTNIIR